MTIQELKLQIETGSITDNLIIFKDHDSNFISNQYIKAIQKARNLKIQYIDSLNDVISDSRSIFVVDTIDTGTDLRVLKSEVFIWGTEKISSLKNVIVVVHKFDNKEQEEQLAPWTVVVPHIEDWQLKDYVYSTTEGVDFKDLDWLISLCGPNYDRLQNELDKVCLFSVSERSYLFSDLIRDGAVDELSSFNIFNLTDAITSKNVKGVLSVYREIDRVDVNEFGLLTILLKNFRNMLMVQLNDNPTPENTGLSDKMIYRLKKSPKAYSSKQLVNIFQLLSDIDRRVKSGELPAEIVIDYLIVKILSM